MKKSSNNLLFLSELNSAEKDRVIIEAQNILAHHFEILSKKIKFGKKINWHTNFLGGSWPFEPYLEFRAHNYDFNSTKYLSDIKLPWEFNKHLFLQDLAKAYLLTRDEKYTQEFIDEIQDWLDKNPFEVGVNWTEGLISSHRVISWIIALSAFSKSPKINDSFLDKITKSIYQHSLFIEKTYEFCPRASNHLLGEFCAQIMLSVVFPEFTGSKKRLQKAINFLEKELELQVYNDGVDYEESISYQRVILEFLYLPLILAKRKLVKLPQSIWNKTEKMTEFMMHMTQPNGLLQPISDADGARVFVLGNDINDFRPHLGLAAWLFDRPDFKFVSENQIDQIAWFLSNEELSALDKIVPKVPEEVSKAFKSGGYWISRQNWSKDSSWLFFDCGYMGMGPWDKSIPVGVHGHSDTLNFGLALGGETFLTDNGAYCYTTERPFHLYFRSSIAHNVALVNGQDQNIIDNRPWLAYQQALPQNASHIFTDEIDYLSGEHTGYLRLPGKIIQRREIMHFKNRNFLILKDSFLGEGTHKITENFHLMPGLKIKKKDGGFEIIGKHILNIQPLFDAQTNIVTGKTKPVEGWYAPNFGKKIPAGQLKFDFETQCPSSHYFLFSWGQKSLALSEVIKLFENTYERLRKPRVLMLVTNDLSADPRVQKEALTVSRSDFETTVLAFSPPSSSRSFKSDSYSAKHIAYEPFAPFQHVKAFLGRKIMTIYFKNRYIGMILTPLGRLKKILRTRTLNMIDNDINQPIEQTNLATPAISVKPKQMGLVKKVITAFHYFYFLNRALVSEGVKVHPDIIHAHDLDTLYAGYLIKKKTGAKLIYDSHELWTRQGMPIPVIFVKLMGFLEKFLLKRIDAIISVNDSIIKRLEEIYQYKINVPKIVVYNSPLGNPRKTLGHQTKEIKVLYQGRFAPNRGLEELVQAAKYFNRNIILYFRCTGEKDIEQKIREKVKKEQLEKKIQFLKPVSMHELAKSAQFAQIGVIPYLPVNENNRLATPNKLFEYAMSGLAIAGSDLPEIAKFVKVSKNGLLFNPYRPENIAKVINQMAADRQALLTMRHNSLGAAKIYNWENQAKKLISLYKEILHE